MPSISELHCYGSTIPERAHKETNIEASFGIVFCFLFVQAPPTETLSCIFGKPTGYRVSKIAVSHNPGGGSRDLNHRFKTFEHGCSGNPGESCHAYTPD
jgi:hypothetical protein